MNWITIDHATQAVEIPGAGCFVMFFNHHVCFAPGVTINKDKKGTALVAAPYNCTQITFPDFPVTTTTGTTSHVWIGDAGDKLDKKLAELDRKHWRADKQAKNRKPKKKAA